MNLLKVSLSILFAMLAIITSAIPTKVKLDGSPVTNDEAIAMDKSFRSLQGGLTTILDWRTRNPDATVLDDPNVQKLYKILRILRDAIVKMDKLTPPGEIDFSFLSSD
jgi:hypothetical protein